MESQIQMVHVSEEQRIMKPKTKDSKSGAKKKIERQVNLFDEGFRNVGDISLMNTMKLSKTKPYESDN